MERLSLSSRTPKLDLKQLETQKQISLMCAHLSHSAQVSSVRVRINDSEARCHVTIVSDRGEFDVSSVKPRLVQKPGRRARRPP